MKSKVVDIQHQKIENIYKKMIKKYDVFVGIPNNNQRYTYRAYEYGDQKLKKTDKKQSKKAPTKISTSKKPFPKIVEVAFWNEFGAPDANIPERSFLRKTVLENEKEYLKIIVNFVKKVFSKGDNLENGFKKLALKVEQDVKECVHEYSTPPNSESTIKAKGINAPLKYKGTLVQSIRGFIKKS